MLAKDKTFHIVLATEWLIVTLSFGFQNNAALALVEMIYIHVLAFGADLAVVQREECDLSSVIWVIEESLVPCPSSLPVSGGLSVRNSVSLSISRV